MAEVRECVDAGYQRIKLKVAPGRGLPAVRAVRRAFPHLLITLDANQSFGLHNLAELRSYDELDIGWIEEPLNLAAAGASGLCETLSPDSRRSSIHWPCPSALTNPS